MTIEQLEFISRLGTVSWILMCLLVFIPIGKIDKNSKIFVPLFIIFIGSMLMKVWADKKLPPKPKLIKTIKYYSNNTIDTTYYAN